MKNKSYIRFALVALLLRPPHLGATVSNAHVDRLDERHLSILWKSSAPVSVYEASQPDATLDQSRLLSDKNYDGRYVISAANDSRHYFLLRDNKDQSILRLAERLLPLQRASNFRDVGGYASADGRHVRWGLIYRSGATPLLSGQDIQYVRSLGLRTMIDLRSTEERPLAPTRLSGLGIRYLAVDYSFESLFPGGLPNLDGPPEPASNPYSGWATLLAPQYKLIFQALLSHQGPLLYSCTAGQDRSGVATALVLTALRVPRKTILEDYHLSTKYRRPEFEMPEIDPPKFPGNPVVPYSMAARTGKPGPLYGTSGRAFLAVDLEEIETQWGSVEKYLEQVLDVGPQQLAELRATYLE